MPGGFSALMLPAPRRMFRSRESSRVSAVQAPPALRAFQSSWLLGTAASIGGILVGAWEMHACAAPPPCRAALVATQQLGSSMAAARTQACCMRTAVALARSLASRPFIQPSRLVCGGCSLEGSGAACVRAVPSFQPHMTLAAGLAPLCARPSHSGKVGWLSFN